MVSTVLSFEAGDVDVAQWIAADSIVGGKILQRDSVLGGAEFASVVLTLTPATLVAIVAILKARWARNGKVSIQAKGVTIKGVNPEDVERILNRILDGEG